MFFDRLPVNLFDKLIRQWNRLKLWCIRGVDLALYNISDGFGCCLLFIYDWTDLFPVYWWCSFVGRLILPASLRGFWRGLQSLAWTKILHKALLTSIDSSGELRFIELTWILGPGVSQSFMILPPNNFPISVSSLLRTGKHQFILKIRLWTLVKGRKVMNHLILWILEMLNLSRRDERQLVGTLGIVAGLLTLRFC